VDLVGVVLLGDLGSEGQHLVGVADVGLVGGDPGAGRCALLGEQPALGHRLGRHVAHGDVAALGGELAGQLASHAGAAAGDGGDASLEALHRSPLIVGAVSLAPAPRPGERGGV